MCEHIELLINHLLRIQRPFKDIVASYGGLSVTAVRKEMSDAIQTACGQLSDSRSEKENHE